jgi:hypothetical protein
VNPFAIASLLLLCVALLLHSHQRRQAWREPGVPWPFYAKRPLAGTEQMLYQRLVMALPDFTILPSVPVSGVLGVRRGQDAQAWTRRIQHLQYDFVICANDATVLAAIDLEGSALGGKLQTSADAIKTRASLAAGVRLLRWQASALPGHGEIQAMFGVPLTHIFEEAASSANQSWWPALSSARRDPPFS